MANIVVRADNNSRVGMGHFTRCTSLAYEFVEQGHRVFLVAGKESRIPDWAEKTYTEISYIDHPWDINSEEKLFKEIIKTRPIDVIVIDTYEASKEYYEFISHYARVEAIFDDMGQVCFPTDVLINGNIYAPKLSYSEYRKNNTLLLLGSRYVPLRPHFRKIKPASASEKASKVLITFGGSDILNATPAVLDVIVQEGFHDLVEFNVVIGPAFTGSDRIKEISAGIENIKLIYNPDNMADIMRDMDLAVSAAGSTVYELACLGVPGIIFTMIDNQEMIAKAMHEEGTCISLGSFNALSCERFPEVFKDLLQNYAVRKAMHDKAVESFDAIGAARCVEAIIQCLESRK